MVNIKADRAHLKRIDDNTTECGIKLSMIGIRVIVTNDLSRVTCSKCLESSRMKEYTKTYFLAIE